MKDEEIIAELEGLYKAFQKIGDIKKAAEIMDKIIALRTREESVQSGDKNILLG